MPSFGLLPTGFVPATEPEIREEMESELRGEFGESLPLGDDTLLGFLVGSISERIALVWEGLEQVNSSQDPDKATGAALQSVCLFSGTFKVAAASSEVVLTLVGDDGTVVPYLSTVATVSTSRQFTTDEDATITLLDSWTPNTDYVVGDRVTNVNRAYICITAGNSAGSGGPVTTSSDETDDTVHWKYLGEGDSAVDVDTSSVETGPIVAAAGDLTSIVTPIPGWNNAVNLLDADLGNDEMTDEELRLLREAEVARPGTGTPPAIRAELLALSGVVNAHVFFNNTDVTDVDGLPPHSTEILVQGGDDQAIWNLLWENVPLGIQTIGDEEGTVVDDEGNNQTLRFSRPEEILIYVYVTLTKLATKYIGDEAVALAIVTDGDGQEIGRDAVASAISGAIGGIGAGVTEVVEVRVYTDVIAAGSPWAPTTAYSATPGARSVVTNDDRSYICITSGTSAGSGGPTGKGTDITDGMAHWRFLGATVTVTSRQLALYDTTRVTVVSSDGAA